MPADTFWDHAGPGDTLCYACLVKLRRNINKDSGTIRVSTNIDSSSEAPTYRPSIEDITMSDNDANTTANAATPSDDGNEIVRMRNLYRSGRGCSVLIDLDDEYWPRRATDSAHTTTNKHNYANID